MRDLIAFCEGKCVKGLRVNRSREFNFITDIFMSTKLFTFRKSLWAVYTGYNARETYPHHDLPGFLSLKKRNINSSFERHRGNQTS